MLLVCKVSVFRASRLDIGLHQEQTCVDLIAFHIHSMRLFYKVTKLIHFGFFGLQLCSRPQII
jgi:hypothetical protein